MNIKESLGLALKKARIAKKVTQEDFSDISSRTYVSTLERGLYTPTVEKVDALAKVIGVHPLTILSLAYLISEEAADASALLNVVNSELKDLVSLIDATQP
ncbi:helix-turn-helix protein [mine drainage metagenome]|uniref:Helix-turn-helix protein n=1 Tax=mine drainage metagenome TaxID=410659 RepID=A0A1J5TFK1_9ZZZZ